MYTSDISRQSSSVLLFGKSREIEVFLFDAFISSRVESTLIISINRKSPDLSAFRPKQKHCFLVIELETRPFLFKKRNQETLLSKIGHSLTFVMVFKVHEPSMND